jgi:hypothetical protein
MKYGFLILCVFAFFNLSCEKEDQQQIGQPVDSLAGLNEMDKFFHGKHPLESFPSFVDTIKKIHYVQIDVWANKTHLFWKNYKGETINCILPYDKMRYEFISEDSYDEPYIKFRWNNAESFDCTKWQDYVIYYVVGTKKSWVVP